ncbi:Protein of unknown function [Ruminococcaceae bacterium YAD3003]|nr:Protein of unknown function [Ruminococcaceae bacterium YAD3003]
MRRVLRDTCILAALMILTVFSFSIAGVGLTDEIKLVFQLFGLALILSVTNYVFDEITQLSMLAGYIVKYFVVTGIVIVFGFIVGWFFPSNFWMAFIYVGVIAAIIYALDSVKTENDIDEINEMVKRSNKEEVRFKSLGQRRGWKVLLVLLAAMVILCAASAAGYFGITGEYKNYFLDGLAVTGPAAVILTAVLISYLAVYFARSKNNPK